MIGEVVVSVVDDDDGETEDMIGGKCYDNRHGQRSMGVIYARVGRVRSKSDESTLIAVKRRRRRWPHAACALIGM